MAADAHEFYINVTVQSTSIRARQALHVPLASEIAAHTFISPARVAPKLAKGMVTAIPYQLSQKGIVAEVETALSLGRFFVMKVTIKDVSYQRILRKLGEQGERESQVASVGGCFMACLPRALKGHLRDSVMGNRIAKKLARYLEGSVQQVSLEQDGVSLIAEGRIAMEQGEYLLQKIAVPKTQPPAPWEALLLSLKSYLIRLLLPVSPEQSDILSVQELDNGD